jgi:hypothetical protein
MEKGPLQNSPFKNIAQKVALSDGRKASKSAVFVVLYGSLGARCYRKGILQPPQSLYFTSTVQPYGSGSLPHWIPVSVS